MKKFLSLSVLAATLAFTSQAQRRLALFEEFTGENCGPCATYNPAFYTLCNSGTNPTKVLHLSYMSPIPSAGWFYYQDSANANNRLRYYNVPFAPYGRHDGREFVVGNSNIVNFTQAMIDTEANRSAPFNMTVSASYNATYDSIIATVNVSCVAAYSGTLYLRLALVQTLDFATSPGSNGSTHFENVVRSMYPNANGTSLSSSWSVGTSQTFTIRCKVPNYVDKSQNPFMVAWIQNDADKSVQQCAKSATLPGFANDAGSIASNGPSGFNCSNGSPYSFTHVVTLKNTGTSTLTSAKIYSSVDGGAYSVYSWSGSLATTNTTNVTIPAMTVPRLPGAGYHVIVDSVDQPNGTTDYNPGNAVTSGFFFLESDSGLVMPYSQTFETNVGDIYSINPNSNSYYWRIVFSGTSTPLGHSGDWVNWHNNYDAPAGEVNTFTLPVVTTTNPSAMDFWVAYKKRNLSSTDKLEVVYSTDCGANWTSIWTKSGTSLAASNIDTMNARFIPTSPSVYRLQSLSLNTVPAHAILGFRATAGGGNYLFVDDINVRSGNPVSVNEVTSEAQLNLSLAPNPATEESVLSYSLIAPSDVTVTLVDVTGRATVVSTEKNAASGNHTVNIKTAGLSAGIYTVVVNTNGGNFTQRLSVIK